MSHLFLLKWTFQHLQHSIPARNEEAERKLRRDIQVKLVLRQPTQFWQYFQSYLSVTVLFSKMLKHKLKFFETIPSQRLN